MSVRRCRFVRRQRTNNGINNGIAHANMGIQLRSANRLTSNVRLLRKGSAYLRLNEVVNVIISRSSVFFLRVRIRAATQANGNHRAVLSLLQYRAIRPNGNSDNGSILSICFRKRTRLCIKSTSVEASGIRRSFTASSTSILHVGIKASD